MRLTPNPGGCPGSKWGMLYTIADVCLIYKLPGSLYPSTWYLLISYVEVRWCCADTAAGVIVPLLCCAGVLSEITGSK